jgi:hypothetical protein
MFLAIESFFLVLEYYHSNLDRNKIKNNMKKLGLLLTIGLMLFIVSCETEQSLENELDATNLKNSEEDAEKDGCETGFAICAPEISTCFLDEGFNRWGWTIGPVASWNGNRTYSIFAGAGQCDISKGELAGKVILNYFNGVAQVDFIAEDGYVFKETHLYIGNDQFPMQIRGNREVPTVAPGQYPFKHDNLDNADKDSYTVDGLSGDIYIIAHSVVCADVD